MKLEIRRRWYLIGLLPIAFGLLSYAIFAHRTFTGYRPLPGEISLDFGDPWQLLWACPITAILVGVALLARRRLAISALLIWVLMAPLMSVVTKPVEMLKLPQFHHYISVAMVPFILYHHKTTWSTKGVLFGFFSFNAFGIITNNLSGGAINFPGEPGVFQPLWLGVAFAIFAAVILFLYEEILRRVRTMMLKRR